VCLDPIECCREFTGDQCEQHPSAALLVAPSHRSTVTTTHDCKLRPCCRKAKSERLRLTLMLETTHDACNAAAVAEADATVGAADGATPMETDAGPPAAEPSAAAAELLATSAGDGDSATVATDSAAAAEALQEGDAEVKVVETGVSGAKRERGAAKKPPVPTRGGKAATRGKGRAAAKAPEPGPHRWPLFRSSPHHAFVGVSVMAEGC
jgi:hypothetical protein